MTDAVEFLDLDDLLGLAGRLLGDPPPVRDVGLLAAAAARPQTTVGGEDAYPSLCAKAAALLQSIVTNHALIEGNKRLGWVAAAVFLEINGASVSGASNDAVYELVIEAASSRVDVEGITARLERFVRERS